MDLAASIQVVTEEVVLKLARHARELTGERNLVLAGGVALNCVANGKLVREKVFDGVWIQPAAGDAGGALGAALLAQHRYFDEPRRLSPQGRDTQKDYLGPAYSGGEVRAFLDKNPYPYHSSPDGQVRAETIARALADGKIVGYLSGRIVVAVARGAVEHSGGPAAKGDAIGDESEDQIQGIVPAVCPFGARKKDASDYFDLDCESPYMLLVAPVREDRRLPMEWPADTTEMVDMLPLVNQSRSDIPAVTHLDYSARVRTRVHASDHPEFHRLISEFKRLTGCGVVVNTSFNVRGEPIVCSPSDAYRCFMRTDMDLLVLEDCLLWKTEQPTFEESEKWEQVL